MDAVDKALATQIANIQKRTGKTLAGSIEGRGLTKFSEQREIDKWDLGLGHGDAKTLIHTISS